MISHSILKHLQPLKKTLINFDEAQEHNAQISEERLKFFAESFHSYDKSLPKEWTPRSGEIKEGKVVKLPGGRKVTIQKKLGSGMFGTVYLVDLEGQPEHCALKIQRTNDPGITNSLSFEFQTQWELDYKLRNHQLAYAPFPRSIKLHTFPDGGLYFMTAVEGKTILEIVNAYIVKRKHVPENVVTLIALQWLKFFDLLHRKCNVVVSCSLTLSL